MYLDFTYANKMAFIKKSPMKLFYFHKTKICVLVACNTVNDR